MSRWRAAAAIAAAGALCAACGVSGGEAGSTILDRAPSVSSAEPLPTTSTTTSTTIATTTTALPPSKAVDGDALSGNLSDQPIDWVVTELDDSTTPARLIATNRSAMPIELALDFSEASRVYAEPAFPAYVLIPPMATIDAATIHPTSPDDGWSYTISTRWILGDPAAKPARATYLRPKWKSGNPAMIGQRPGGKFSHTDAINRWAYDFTMPVGTPVVAARAGTVATIEQGFTEAGTTEDFGLKANSVRILHDDGTYAVYLHLDPRSARVRIGDHVEAGQVIALSGNTGWSKGPHLHLALMANRNHNEESINLALEGE